MFDCCMRFLGKIDCLVMMNVESCRNLSTTVSCDRRRREVRMW